jgi:hypothetical protein
MTPMITATSTPESAYGFPFEAGSTSRHHETASDLDLDLDQLDPQSFAASPRSRGGAGGAVITESAMRNPESSVIRITRWHTPDPRDQGKSLITVVRPGDNTAMFRKDWRNMIPEVRPGHVRAGVGRGRAGVGRGRGLPEYVVRVSALLPLVADGGFAGLPEPCFRHLGCGRGRHD